MNPTTITTALAAVQALGGVAEHRQASANASLLRRIGQIESDEDRRQLRRLIGEQITAQAASGIDPGVGSAVDVRAEAAAFGELAALRRQFGFDTEASAVRAAGIDALASGALRASGTILGGVAEELGRRVPPRAPVRLPGPLAIPAPPARLPNRAAISAVPKRVIF